ncbi:MAG TPA: hypothetical protein DCY88_21095, partial [Cyanobacteria bacterium UBA11372]|nr:hypothetical protein [Cyanobacteria bacterium UBA11372]
KDTLNMKNDSNLFADTHYHLKPEARIIRSKQIVAELKVIPALKPILASQQKETKPAAKQVSK